MAFIKGYKYLIEQDAIDAVVLCNNYYGVPNNGITQEWCNYELYTDYWIIRHYESLSIVLGEPVILEIVEINI